MSPLCVPSFSLIGVGVRKLWAKMQSVRNEEEKNEEIILKLCLLLLRDLLVRFASNLDLPSSAASVEQIWLNLGK